jgi:hypothetical protein
VAALRTGDHRLRAVNPLDEGARGEKARDEGAPAETEVEDPVTGADLQCPECRLHHRFPDPVEESSKKDSAGDPVRPRELAGEEPPKHGYSRLR